MSLLESRIDMREVASDTARNERILSSLFALPGDTTALVFAASIMHAEQLAAVLQVEGVPARAISSTTPPADRRTWIEKFRQGDIGAHELQRPVARIRRSAGGRVYVARPTFSPNRYQQMIGRGLRGAINGGSEEVLIVNVRDNVDAYGQQLAFHHFDHLWRTASVCNWTPNNSQWSSRASHRVLVIAGAGRKKRRSSLVALNSLVKSTGSTAWTKSSSSFSRAAVAAVRPESSRRQLGPSACRRSIPSPRRLCLTLDSTWPSSGVSTRVSVLRAKSSGGRPRSG